MKHITAGAISFLFLAVPLAFAQTAATSTPTVTANPVVVANVTLQAGADYSAGTRSISVHAVVGSTMGDVSDAGFGVILIGKNYYDAVFLPDRLSIPNGGSVVKDLTVEVPQDLSGTVAAYAVVTSLSGITLANQPIWSGTVSANVAANLLSCKAGVKSATCTVASGKYTLTYHVYQGAPGGRERGFAFESDAGGKSLTVPKDALPPGAYSVIVHLTDAGQTTVYAARRSDLVMAGTQGGIDVFSLEDEGGGSYFITATTHVLSFGTSTIPRLSFQAMKDGVTCGAPLVATTTTLVRLSYHPGCDADSVVATLTGNGIRLDSATAKILTHKFAFGAWTWPSALMLIILVAAGLTAYAMRRRPMVSPPPPASPQTPINPNPYA